MFCQYFDSAHLFLSAVRKALRLLKQNNSANLKKLPKLFDHVQGFSRPGPVFIIYIFNFENNTGSRKKIVGAGAAQKARAPKPGSCGKKDKSNCNGNEEQVEITNNNGNICSQPTKYTALRPKSCRFATLLLKIVLKLHFDYFSCFSRSQNVKTLQQAMHSVCVAIYYPSETALSN